MAFFIFGTDIHTDISAIHGPIADISKSYLVFCFIMIIKNMHSMPYLFFKNFKNHGL